MGRSKQPTRVITIEFEYKGRKVNVRQSTNYKTTLSAVKKLFKDLHSVSDDRIAFSSIVEDGEDATEITPDK
ncbi:hypothetical protein FRC07_006675 [Ceratobasidium sp. 392]|nr:hypothetical protein FRC07_006675 [Ceratobasidium sp. 392]